ncbi:MAG: hypothetical protein EA363_10375 [Balneolaceae bacterium]|nr:MAG: hypothetical protein EA363_10375 [Balneolaceae bacterium]
MSDQFEINPDAPEAFEEDINQLVEALKAELGGGASRWYYDEPSETLYIELECLQHLAEEEIEKKAGPILEESDLDFEEILLLPMEQ